MNSTQLIRGAAFQKLTETLLLQPDPQRENRPVLTHRGNSLVKQLARSLKVMLNPLAADHPLLQGSLATFQPDLSGSRRVGTLSYNGQLDQAEQNFAIAHELAHLVLHRGQAVACRHSDFENTASEESPLAGQVEIYNPRNQREREASIFALELLMPTFEIRQEYLRCYKADSGPQVLDQLAGYFGVKRGRVLLQLLNVFLGAPLPVNKIQPDRATEAKAERSLDAEQLKAAHQAAPAQVLAGPGSGKTTTLVERVRHLVKDSGVEPAHLLVLTFSNKTARELRERLSGAGLPAHEMLITTFHAYGADFLRRYAALCQLPADFRLLDKAHAYMLLEDLLGELPSGHYINQHNPDGRFKDILEDISRAKDYLNTPESYRQAVEAMAASEQPAYDPFDVQKAQERADIYAVYERHKQARGMVDFSDLVMKPVLLMRENAQVLQAERDRYQEILVDEYQDINYASGELLRLLASPASGGRGNLWAVGDIHQSIYRFRGAYPAQAGADRFVQDYHSEQRPAGVLELRANYRSLEPVVRLASHLRQTMPEGATSPMVASRGNGADDQAILHYTEFESSGQEMAAIIASIQTHHSAGQPYASHAILCQRHKQADAFALALTQAGIPVNRVDQFFNRDQIQQCVAVVAALSGQLRPAFFRLGLGRLPMLKVFGLADQFHLAPRPALTDARVLDELTPAEREAAFRLNLMLESLHSWRNIWRLLAEYLFGWSDLVPQLVERETGDYSARQSLRALGQFIQLAYAFDQEEEAWLIKQARQRAGTPELTLEQEMEARRRLNKDSHRRKFMRYVHALVNSDARLEPEVEAQEDATQLDAVHILTAHASKGLEFPFVYLPGLRHRKTNPGPDTPPPGLYHGLYTGQAADEPCLFYVSATRAKDKLFLSWAYVDADNEADFAAKAPRRQRISPILEPVSEFISRHPQLWQSLAVPPDWEQPATAAKPPDNGSVGAAPVMAGPMPEYDFWQLHTYSKCPARYYYEHVQHCRGRRDDNKNHFYKGLSQAHIRLNKALNETGQLPELAQLQAAFNEAWPPADSTDHTARATEGSQSAAEADGEQAPDRDTPTDYYYQTGQCMVERMLEHYRQSVEQSGGAEVRETQFNQPAQVKLANCRVNFQIDRQERLSDGTLRLIRSRVGNLPDQQKLDDDTDTYRLLTLYFMAGGESAQVVLEALGPHGVGQIVADKAATKAATYRKILAGKSKGKNLLQELERNADGIRSGLFVPNPGQDCQRCPFYIMLCPTRLE
ncbi:MAG TPA: ATP-dependent helicase [Chloroflexia bacterium]|nr:ATP-dependent helicase [Chloroflexia bacterium]